MFDTLSYLTNKIPGNMWDGSIELSKHELKGLFTYLGRA